MFKKLNWLFIAGLGVYVGVLEVRVANLKAKISDIKGKHDTCKVKLLNTINYNNELNKTLEKQSIYIKNMSIEAMKRYEEYTNNSALSQSLMEVIQKQADSCEALKEKINLMGKVDYENM